MDNSEINFEYSTLLAPPDGYTLSKAIGTTYSLDLRTTLSIPLAFHFKTGLDPELISDPFALFISLKNTSSKVDMFCQLGGINANVSNNKLFRFVENNIHEISLVNGKSFHPKIWIIKYEMKDMPSIFKVINLSRNMTMDRSWDMAIAMQGEVNDPGTLIDKKTNQPLSDFIEFLYRQKGMEIPAKFISELERVNFRPLGDKFYTKIEFLPLGIGNDAGSLDIIHNDLEDDPYDQITVVSPFVTQSVIDKIVANSKQTTLISRLSTLEDLDQKKLLNLDCYSINEKIVSGGSSQLNEEQIISADVRNGQSDENALPLFDLHAKVYFVKLGGTYYISVGSANASQNAFYGNVEFMINLEGQRKNSAEYFIETYFNQSNDFLIKYEPDLSRKKEIDNSIEKEVENYLAQICIDLSKYKFDCILQSNGHYTVKLTTGFIDNLNTEYEVYIRPISVDESYHLSISSNLIFTDINLVDLSVLYVLTVVDPVSGIKRSSIIKLDIENLPEQREEAVVRSLIDNKASLFRLLRLLLSDDLIDVLMEGDLDQESIPGGSTWQHSSGDEFTIFEKMMVASSRNPAKLQEVNSIIEYLNNDETSAQIVDMDIQKFVSFWNNFKEVIKN